MPMKTDCHLPWDSINGVYKTTCEVDESIIDFFVSVGKLSDAADFSLLPSYMDVEVVIRPEDIKGDHIPISFYTNADVPKQWIENTQLYEKNKGLMSPSIRNNTEKDPKVQFTIFVERACVEIMEQQTIHVSL